MKDILEGVGVIVIGVIAITIFTVEAGVNDYWHGVMMGGLGGWALWRR